MPDIYKMAIQSTLEIFAFITILIGFANEDKISAWERRKWKNFKRWLHRRLNSNKKIVQWARPQKHRKRAKIGDYDCYEDAYSRSANWEPKYNKNDFNGEGKQ